MRNKPKNISQVQVKSKKVKMSVSESLCLLRNIGVLIGDKVPDQNPFWKLVVGLKSILDIFDFLVINQGLIIILQKLIKQYLNRPSGIFPANSIKPKHHFIIHYPEIIKRLGPLRNLSTMNCERENFDLKISSHVSFNRVNVKKTVAIKNQLQFSRRLLCEKSVLHTKSILRNKLLLTNFPNFTNTLHVYRSS